MWFPGVRGYEWLGEPQPRLNQSILPTAAATGASITDDGWFDLVRRGRLPLTGSFVPVDTPYGKFARPGYNNTQYSFTAGLTGTVDPDTSAPVMLSSLVYIKNAPTFTGTSFRASLLQGSAGDRVSFAVNDQGIRISVPDSGGTADTITTALSFPAALGLHHVVLYAADTDVRVWVDGALHTTSTGSRVWAASSVFNSLYGLDGSGSEAEVGVLHQFYWDAASPELAAYVARDWRQLYEPKRIWVPVSAASGPPTLAAIAASNLTASGARLTVTV